MEIFHGTIDENIHLNRPNIHAQDVRDALRTVDLLDEILQLPDGLNTMLQTGGSPLTQNQTLRLMIARAIVGTPRLLLIDGTLDALADGQATEILKSLVDPAAGWTLLIATGARH